MSAASTTYSPATTAPAGWATLSFTIAEPSCMLLGDISGPRAATCTGPRSSQTTSSQFAYAMECMRVAAEAPLLLQTRSMYGESDGRCSISIT